MDHLVKEVDLLLKCEAVLEGYDDGVHDLCDKAYGQITLMRRKIDELRNIVNEQRSQICESKVKNVLVE